MKKIFLFALIFGATSFFVMAQDANYDAAGSNL
jgi:hypothetical protein